MARTHHRKKHKEHLRQFKQTQDSASIPAAARTKASVVFSILGGILGLAICYFASNNMLWSAGGLMAGAIAGYYIGRNVDKGK